MFNFSAKLLVAILILHAGLAHSADREALANELRNVERMLERAKASGNQRQIKILTDQVELRSEQLSKLPEAPEAPNPSDTPLKKGDYIVSESGKLGVFEGYSDDTARFRSLDGTLHTSSPKQLRAARESRVLSASGKEGVFLDVRNDRVVFQADDGSLFETPRSKVFFEVSEVEVGQDRFRFGQPYTYVDTLFGDYGEYSRGHKSDTLKRVFADGRARLVNGKLIRLAGRRALALIPGIGTTLGALDYVTSATPAQAATYQDKYLKTPEGIMEFLKLPDEEQQKLIEGNSQFKRDLDNLLTGIVDENGGTPQNIQCEDSGRKVNFDLKPSDYGAKARQVNVEYSESGSLKSIRVIEQSKNNSKSTIFFDYNDEGEITRVRPQVDLRSRRAKTFVAKLNRPMSFNEFEKVVQNYPNGVAKAQLVHQSAALPTYLTLVAGQLTEGCAKTRTPKSKVEPAGASSQQAETVN